MTPDFVPFLYSSLEYGCGYVGGVNLCSSSKMEASSSRFSTSMSSDELITWLREKGLDIDDCDRIRSKETSSS